MTNANHNTWIITDNRAGNNSQVKGVASAIQEDFFEINLEYSSLIRLPNLVRGTSLMGLAEVSKDNIAHILESVQNGSMGLPSYIISAGRRSASVSRYLKRFFHKNLNHTLKNCHIMNPNSGFSDFDLVVLFKHDVHGKKYPNVLEVGTSPSVISPQRLQDEAIQWQDKLAEYPQPFIGVLVGGTSKSGNFNEEDMTLFINKLAEDVQKTAGTLLISTSRRTPPPLVEALRANKYTSRYLYDWNSPDSSLENPYMGILSLSRYIIITGDSMSMISESCATQAEGVFIYNTAEISSHKHQRMHQFLYDNNMAKSYMDNPLEGWNRPSFNSSQQIAEKLLSL